MTKHISSILLVVCICIFAQAQTPYDSFAPHISRPILDVEAVSSHKAASHISQDTIFYKSVIDPHQGLILLTDVSSGKIIAYVPITDDIHKWLSPDPLLDKYPEISPYAYCAWNPMKYVDPDGKNPVYDLDGNLLGTDENGLQGKPLVMDSKLFTQGMAQDIAEGFNVGIEFLEGDTRNFMQENYVELSHRPDWDGRLSLFEANNWYRKGDGSPLFVDASKIDLSPLKKSDFSNVGSSEYVNFLDPRNFNMQTGLVYGTIQVTLISNDGRVSLGNKNGVLDIYNFDMQNGRNIRNIATRLGSIVAGKGTPFIIYHYGQGKIK